MTKLIIQIPCFNEEDSLPVTLAALPRSLPGIDDIEWLIIDDGSTDKTVEVARAHGVDHIVGFPRNAGLAKGFMAGLEACLKARADIIVNTDADNQYCANDIETLLQPILEKRADIVIGARPISDIAHFSPVKKALQKLGSWVVRTLSGTDIPDAPSGFRAFSRDAAMQLFVFNTHTYTLETIIQAGRRGIPITWVPVRVNEDLRPSRLVRSIPEYISRSIMVLVRIFMIYQPLRFFLTLAAVPMALGTALGLRWLLLVYAFPEPGRTYMPSLILAAVLLIAGFQIGLFGLFADVVSANRRLLEDIRLRQQRKALARDEDDGI